MKAIRVKEEWERAGVYYVRTEAMVFGFDLSMQGEFSDDNRDSEYILVVDDNGKPLSTNRLHFLPEKGFAKIERVATVRSARGLGAGKLGIQSAEELIYERGNDKIVITSREEVKGFYEKLGYTVRYDMSPDTLEKKVEGEEKPVKDPRFICVYMEKVVDTPKTV